MPFLKLLRNRSNRNNNKNNQNTKPDSIVQERLPDTIQTQQITAIEPTKNSADSSWIRNINDWSNWIDNRFQGFIEYFFPATWWDYKPLDPSDEAALAEQAIQKALREEYNRQRVQREKIIRANYNDDVGRAKQKKIISNNWFDEEVAYLKHKRQQAEGIVPGLGMDTSKIPGWEITRGETNFRGHLKLCQDLQCLQANNDLFKIDNIDNSKEYQCQLNIQTLEEEKHQYFIENIRLKQLLNKQQDHIDLQVQQTHLPNYASNDNSFSNQYRLSNYANHPQVQHQQNPNQLVQHQQNPNQLVQYQQNPNPQVPYQQNLNQPNSNQLVQIPYNQPHIAPISIKPNKPKTYWIEFGFDIMAAFRREGLVQSIFAFVFFPVTLLQTNCPLWEGRPPVGFLRVFFFALFGTAWVFGALITLGLGSLIFTQLYIQLRNYFNALSELKKYLQDKKKTSQKKNRNKSRFGKNDNKEYQNHKNKIFLPGKLLNNVLSINRGGAIHGITAMNEYLTYSDQEQILRLLNYIFFQINIEKIKRTNSQIPKINKSLQIQYNLGYSAMGYIGLAIATINSKPLSFIQTPQQAQQPQQIFSADKIYTQQYNKDCKNIQVGNKILTFTTLLEMLEKVEKQDSSKIDSFNKLKDQPKYSAPKVNLRKAKTVRLSNLTPLPDFDDLELENILTENLLLIKY